MGHEAVAGGVVDADAQVAGALVEEERADLEDGAFAAAVEVAEVHEVDEELVEVAVVADEAVDFGDGGGFGLEGLVLGDEGGDLGFGVGGEDGADAVEAEAFDGEAGLGGEPCVEGGELGDDGGPVGFVEGGLVAEEGDEDLGAEGLDGGAPGGVDGGGIVGEGERDVGCDFGEGECGDFGGGGGEADRAERGVVGLGAVDGAGGAGVEGGEAAAGEVVVDFCGDGFDGGCAGGGVWAEGEFRGFGLRAAVPVGERGGVGEEEVEFCLRDSGFARSGRFPRPCR